MNGEINNVPARARLEPLLTVEDLERLLRVDRRTVARLCKKGQLPQPLKVGGGNRWRSADISNVLDGLSAERSRVRERDEVLAEAV